MRCFRSEAPKKKEKKTAETEVEEAPKKTKPEKMAEAEGEVVAVTAELTSLLISFRPDRIMEWFLAAVAYWLWR